MRSAWSASAIFALVPLLVWGCGGNGDGNVTAPLPGTGNIQGTVVDDVGDPVLGATTRLRNRGAMANLTSQTTGANGSYNFSGVDPGDYDIFLEIPAGFDLNGQVNPVMVSVQEGQTSTANFAIRLTSAGTINGNLTEGGNAVQGATAALRNAGSSTNLRTTTSDASGNYSFTRVPVGDYDVFLTAPSGLAVDLPNPVRVTVTQGGTALADFTLSVAPVSFANDIQPIFSSSCAFSGCHGANANPTGKPMVLSPGQAFSNIVNVESFERPGMDRIEPSDPDNSYLIHKIQGTQASVNGSGSRMPLGAPPLPQATIDLIRQWVTDGAPNN